MTSFVRGGIWSIACAGLMIAACSDESAPAAPASTVADVFRRLGDALGQTIAGLKSSAITAGTVVPAELGSVAKVPKDVTGGVDIGASQSGKSGEKATNVDGVGADEPVAIFVPDVKTGNGTTATLPSFVAWKGDADSDDEGLCYLGFTKGASWLVVSKCADASGAWVCQVTSSEATCNACNLQGACTPCDMTESKLTCAWP
jgi:hypothetical protein